MRLDESNLSRGLAPLWRHYQQSPVNPGLPPPASSALELSQPFDGFLLCMASLSYFIGTTYGVQSSKNRAIAASVFVSRIE
jgi:hypothetical protein